MIIYADGRALFCYIDSEKLFKVVMQPHQSTTEDDCVQVMYSWLSVMISFFMAIFQNDGYIWKIRFSYTTRKRDLQLTIQLP